MNYLIKTINNVFQFINLDIWKVIFEYLDFLSKIRFRQVNKYFYHNLDIEDFYHIECKYLSKLTDEILINYKKIKYLDAFNNHKIKDVSWMSYFNISTKY